MDVPSILIVAPNGIVKDEILFRDTHFFQLKYQYSLELLHWMLMLKKQKPLLGKKFLIKIIGFNPEKSLTLTYKPQNIELLMQVIHRTYILIMG